MTLKKCSRCTVYSMKGQRLGEARVTHFGDTVTLFFSDARLRDPKIKAKINFYDDVLGVLQTLAGAIDAIFGSNLAGSVQGWRDDQCDSAAKGCAR